jgi:hypothetical protein
MQASSRCYADPRTLSLRASAVQPTQVGAPLVERGPVAVCGSE